ncbi:MAG: bifunctional histidinol-phosphatase/imidazoleglycerol-phosphate dehydratase HisB [Bacteroidia bacterium]|nr:bifunctional histidinol-phosphatase/imidazoleglycerol-phosphate dehydratase HisB [Bacteroidia bacterium]
MKKKVLFIDRDGVLLVEPPSDYQVDSFDKVAFVPNMLTSLSRIAGECDYDLVMVTNQDGLGTDSFPEEDFWGPQVLMLDTLRSVGVEFKEIHIDRTFAAENAPTRKPGTGLLNHFMNGDYDLAASFVIGDRTSDMLLAQNLGCRGIKFGVSLDSADEEKWKKYNVEDIIALRTDDWNEIHRYLVQLPRAVHIKRSTSETEISIKLDLDGNGKADISTGLHFFDHMLEQIARHGQLDLEIEVNGDLEIDEHHTIEDTGLALGTAFLEALGNKAGIERYGFYLPMDESLAQVGIDFGGRPWLAWEAEFKREKIGDMPTEMFHHFFKSFTDNAKCNLNIKVEGSNEHHMIESIFKAFAKAIKRAKKRDFDDMQIPSTKGIL